MYDQSRPTTARLFFLLGYQRMECLIIKPYEITDRLGLVPIPSGAALSGALKNGRATVQLVQAGFDNVDNGFLRESTVSVHAVLCGLSFRTYFDKVITMAERLKVVANDLSCTLA